MKRFIAFISLIFSIHGIFGVFYVYLFGFESLNQTIYTLMYNLRIYFFNVLEIDLVTKRISDTSYSSTPVSLLDIFFLLSFLIGAIVYIASKYRETRLLKFNCGLIILDSVRRIIFIIVNLNNPQANKMYSFIFLMLSLGYFAISIYFITKHLDSQELSTYEENEKTYFENASKSKRFLNLIIDTLLIVLICYLMVGNATRNEAMGSFFIKLEATFGEQFGGLIFFSVLKFAYYFGFESICRATPGKFLTRCKVTDEDGNNPSLRNIFIRTLCRFVPFESISFLMGSNLHDNYSYTNVINQKQQSNTDRYYLIFLVIGFISILVVYFYDKF